MSTDKVMTHEDVNGLTNSKIMSTSTMTGAGLGFLSFLPLGLTPALYFGGFAGLILAGGIFGTPVPQVLLAQGLVVFGMILGLLAVCSLFLVSGAFAGSMFGWVYLALTGRTHDVHAEE